MEIKKTLTNDTLTLELNGRLDTVTAPELEAETVNLDKVKTLVLDFTNLEYISSAGLRVLLKAQKTMTTHGSMIVTNVNKSVNEVFKITGFSDFLTIK